MGGHAAVAGAILEDVELAKLVKRAGYRLQFRLSDVVSTQMYRSFPQMWEGWTKNLALLFPDPRRLAVSRCWSSLTCCASSAAAVVNFVHGETVKGAVAAVIAIVSATFP